MKKKIVISGPILSRSGYGEMARFAYRALKQKNDKYEIYILSTNWGGTGSLPTSDAEVNEIYSKILETQNFLQSTNNNPNFDISIQVTIPNEWKRMAAVNIGYTAGIETNLISPAWLEPSNMMDKVIVISNHAKSSFLNTIFGDNAGKQYKVTTPIEVCHFPVKNYKNLNFDLELEYDFNFLSVCQWGPRKNLEQTIINFLEEFKNEQVGLVLKINIVNDSILDRDEAYKKLEELTARYPDRKCKIYMLHGMLSEEEMNAIYLNKKIKAIVSSTHGEGFGFPLFEAAYNELPVIATDWSGHLDFLVMKDDDGADKKMFAKVEYELKPIAKEHVWKGILEEGTSWAYPLQNSFKSRMREVYKDYGRFKSWAKKLNLWVRSEFTEEKVYSKFIEIITGEKNINISLEELPKISIITSVFNGDEFIKPFLEDITNQTIFKEKCELVLVNADSPGNEEAIIQEYMQKFPNNIKYKKLDTDPGIYACWNIAAKIATGEFLTNANLDDRKSPKFMEELAKELVINKDIDVVYASNLLTNAPNETWEKNTSKSEYPSEDFSLEAMLRGNPPHCMPMWRKTLHDKNGYFEEKYRSASDWEFWLRCAFAGAKMLKVNKKLGLYYFNPKGISTNQENNSWKRQEEKEIFKKYLKMFQERQN